MTFFGLKSDQDLFNWAAHPHQEFPGVPPHPPQGEYSLLSSPLVAMELSLPRNVRSGEERGEKAVFAG